MRSFTALVNPIAGGGSAAQRWQPLADLITAAGAAVTVELTESQPHAVELAAKAAQRGDVVVAVGGDGLVRDVAQGVVAADGTLGIVPAGRGNDLARKLDLPTDHAALGELLLNAPERRIDVIDAAGSIVLGNVYAGIDSLSARIINDNRWMPAKLIYRLAPALALLRWQPPVYTVTADGETITAKADTVIVANSGTYGHGLRIVPDAVVDDGLLDVMIVSAGPKRRLAAFMSQAKTGTHVGRPEVRVVRAREVTLDADRPVPVGADGDDLGALPCKIRIRPAALRILAP
ncbi:Transcription regulator [contains diacylglycerol kinase catalytic domain] [Alloactinosynnema sp. L-07]|uniref:diacylglycerol/lipid kinase family protein n=1 Tax=Alloactinosynnema sp. L-07 TaxID=1653480 RepID=UPI00065F0417|nr:diacylglycerol kinase family protein [Alloactinosynnema sp. L-07]CRK58813.1 Transcription regulator [contains diacylglycerol kinase catalytic domain] [Alloactinosynnema sp. L-07]